MERTTVNKRPKKRPTARKAQERCKTWRRHLLEWVVLLPFCGLYIALFKLSGCTMGNQPSGLFWYIVLITVFAVIVWAWLKNNLKGNLILYSGIGFLLGNVMYGLIMTLFLGSNYLFPRSEPERRKAVVCAKKEERHFRGPTSYLIGLRFDDGRYCSWNGGYKEFERFQKGDTCAVSVYKGLWGLVVVRDVEVVGRVKKRHLNPAMLRWVEVRPRTLDMNIFRALGRDEHIDRYGFPMSIQRVTGRDMCGEFRVGLLNLATFEEIDEGKRTFVECTWILGDESSGQRLTYWYEWRQNQLQAVDSMQWSTDEEF